MINSKPQNLDIQDKYYQYLLEVFKIYIPSASVWAYGSRVKGTAKNHSDLDIVTVVDENQKKNIAELKEELEESSLPFRVDLFIWDEIPEEFKANIEKEKIVLVGISECRELGKDRQGRGMGCNWKETEYGKISQYFKSSLLREICIEKIGVQTGPFGSQLHKEDYVETGTPIITVEHLGDNRITYDNIPNVSHSDKIRLSKYTLQTDDIVFSRVGSVDRRALVREAESGWLFSGRCLRVRANKSKINPIYLSYFFGLESFKKYIRNIAVGATMPSINTKILSEMPIYYPSSLFIQKKIANILSSIDDKITLNTQTNKTLEAMAQALFKSWFVDFDPVKAKIRGEQPEGMDAETAALFPSKLVESELGLIPEGWGVKTFGDVLNCFDSKRIPLSKQQREKMQGDIPYHGATSIMDYVNEYIFDGVYVLIGEDGSVMHDDGTPFIQYIWGKFWINNHAHILQGKDSVGTEQLMLFIKNQNITPYITGAVQLKLNQKNMNSIPFILALDKINDAFNQKIKPFYAIYRKNCEEILTLMKLRDTLLPKLLSGEINIGVQ